MRQGILSAALVVVFALMLTVFPGEYMAFVLAYFAIFLGLAIFLGARAYKRGVSAAAEISRGRPILEVDEKEVRKVMERDRELAGEYRKIARASIMPLLLIPAAVALAMVLFPAVPPALESALGQHVGALAARFLSYLLVFGAMSALFGKIARPVTAPRIVMSLKVYDTGLVIDGKFGLKAPLEVSEYRVSEERKFVEFRLGNQTFRVYCKNVRELDRILSSKIVKSLK
jgi:uncharacterized membrane protein